MDGVVGCRLETMNVSDGKRMVIYEKQGRFEAPNWMPDGKQLLFNMDGLLYKIAVTVGDLFNSIPDPLQGIITIMESHSMANY
jgi:hypothetical protein